MTEELSPELYQELHRLAGSYMRRERTAHTLQTTALLHEAYLRIAEHLDPERHDHGMMMGIAARAMRRVLIDHARKKAALKRGGGAERLTLRTVATDGDPPVDLLALNDCLDELAELDERKARIVELIFFAGLEVPEVARILGMGQRTVELDWAMARAWLRGRLGDSASE